MDGQRRFRADPDVAVAVASSDAQNSPPCSQVEGYWSPLTVPRLERGPGLGRVNGFPVGGEAAGVGCRPPNAGYGVAGGRGFDLLAGHFGRSCGGRNDAGAERKQQGSGSETRRRATTRRPASSGTTPASASPFPWKTSTPSCPGSRKARICTRACSASRPRARTSTASRRRCSR